MHHSPSLRQYFPFDASAISETMNKLAGATTKTPIKLPKNQPAEAIKQSTTFSRKNNETRRNGGISHPPIATVYSSMHPLVMETDLVRGFIQKVIESPKICRPKQSASNFWTKHKHTRQNNSIKCPPVSHRLIINAAASCGKSFEDVFIITAVRFPKNPSAAAPRNIFNSKKRQPKAVKQNPAYLLTTAWTLPWYF